MKHLRKVLALVLAAFTALVVATPAFAADAGSIKVTNAQKGNTYELYKLFDATVAPDGKIAYSLPTGKDVENDDFFNTYFDVVNGNVIAKDTFTETVVGGNDFKTWAESFGTKVGDTVTADSSTVTWSPIDYGYYFVKTNTGAVLTVDSANPAAEVIDKNQKVSFDKKIVENGTDVSVNEAGLDEPVDFKITAKAKNYDGKEKVYKYVIYDTMEQGFSLIAAPVVKIDGADPTTTCTITYKKAGAATTTVTEADYFEITLNWTENGEYSGDFAYDANAEIVVTYQAKLDPAKADKVKIGANKNEGQIKWFKGSDNPDTPNGELPKVETNTYDTGLTITKTDGTQVLTGAEFTLTSTDGSTKVSYTKGTKYTEDAAGTYYKLKDGTYTAEAPNGNATHDSVYDSTQTKYKLEEVLEVQGEGQTPSTISAFVGADGKVSFNGLAVGTYTIEETVVPAGYNKADDIKFTISFDPATKKFASDNDDVKLNETSGVFETTVVNNQGTELPSTGGMGTTILYTLGGILVVGGAIFLIAKNRSAKMGA